MNSKMFSRAGIVALAIGSVMLFGQGCNWSKNTADGTKKVDDAASKTPTTTSTSGTQTQQKDPNTKAADLRVILNALNRQHVYLAAAAMRSTYDARPDATAAKEALDENSQAVASEIGKMYGSSVSNEFLTEWRKHADAYMAYATATKAGDSVAKDKAVQKMSTQVDKIATILVRSNSYLAQSSVRQMLTDHASAMKSMMDSYAARDYSGSFTKELDADESVGKFADALTTAIVKQFPTKF